MREVFFCKPLKSGDLTKSGRFYTGVENHLVKKVKSDTDGNFAVSLPEGKYSVFTKEDEGFYANSFDGQGFIQLVTVKQDEVTYLTLKVDYKAAY